MPADIPPPIIIGATGGSGTRALVLVLREVGMAFGTNLNRSQDAMVFAQLYDRWVDRYVAHQHGTRLPALWRRRMERAYRRAARAYLADAKPGPGQPWGWKNPRSVYVLPALDEWFPRMRYVHVIRDPRDMAFSQNRNVLLRHPGLHLREEERAEPPAVQSALVWHRANTDAWRYGTEEMGERYRVVRFEDLCLDPGGTITGLARFARLPEPDDSQLARAAAHVRPPSSMGRYREQEPGMRGRIEEILTEDLGRFGYDDEDWLGRVHALSHG